MAEPENEQTQQQEQDGQEQKEAKKRSLLPFIIGAAVLLICCGSGFFLGRIIAGGPEQASFETEAQTEGEPEVDLKNQKNWYYDLEPVVANLDEPGATRYIRTTLTLEIDGAAPQDKTTVLLDEKKPILINWVTIYLASLTLEDVTGDKNLKRIQSHIVDAVNETLYPDSKPRIKHVLFKEFAIQ